MKAALGRLYMCVKFRGNFLLGVETVRVVKSMPPRRSLLNPKGLGDCNLMIALGCGLNRLLTGRTPLSDRIQKTAVVILAPMLPSRRKFAGAIVTGSWLYSMRRVVEVQKNIQNIYKKIDPIACKYFK